MRVWIDPNDLTWFLAWTLRGHSFCPRKVIDPILFDPFLAQAFRMTCVWLDWSYFMSILSENDRDSFLCTASFFVKVLFSLIGDVYIVLEGGPEVAAQVTLARRWSTHQTQIAQANTGTSWKDNKRYHSRCHHDGFHVSEKLGALPKAKTQVDCVLQEFIPAPALETTRDNPSRYCSRNKNPETNCLVRETTSTLATPWWREISDAPPSYL